MLLFLSVIDGTASEAYSMASGGHKTTRGSAAHVPNSMGRVSNKKSFQRKFILTDLLLARCITFYTNDIEWTSHDNFGEHS